jgi:endosialidase-like protein
MNPLIHLKQTIPLLLIPLGIVCFALLPSAQSVTPAPDGAYPNGNTAEGGSALLSLTTGGFDTAIGAAALLSDTTGSSNTAVGANSLRLLTTGSGNTAMGTNALFNNNANNNTAVGGNALFSNTGGEDNVAVGNGALSSNANSGGNTAIGFQALRSNDGGGLNTAVGYQALLSNKIGSGNTATGSAALQRNRRTGNTANGYSALAFNVTGSNNTAAGAGALSSFTGDNNTALGVTAAFENIGSNNLDIDNQGVAGDNSTIRIGTPVSFDVFNGGVHLPHTRTFIAGIRGRTTANANAVPVLIDSAGQLGTASSSRRFKNEIKPMNKTSEAIFALKPVTFHYKSDNTGTPQFGLIAEEVAKVNPDLIVRDENGEIYTVRYDAVNAMLLNEFLKEHRKVQELEANTAKQQKQIEALTAGLQKVSA